MLVATLVISGREWLWPLATFLVVALVALAWAYSRATAGGTIRGVCIFLKGLGLLTLAAGRAGFSAGFGTGASFGA